MSDYLISIQEIQNYLFKQGYSSPGNVNTDNNLQIFREAAEDEIKQYLGFNFISTLRTEEYSGNNNVLLYTYSRPITAVTEVKVDNSVVDDYDIKDNYLIRRKGWDSGLHNITVKYTAGYTRKSIPGLMRLVALKLCGYYYLQQNRESVSSESLEGGSSKTFDLESKDRILSALSSYRSYV